MSKKTALKWENIGGGFEVREDPRQCRISERFLKWLTGSHEIFLCELSFFREKRKWVNV